MISYALVALFTIACFSGTGDSGDSIHHYLFAKFAGKHPELFFDHWAKPVYVLLAYPFAQLGFVGIKILNACLSLSTIYCTFKVAEKLNLKNALMVTVLLAFMPLYYVLTFSGLTEPLFAFFISFSLYLCLTQRYNVAAVLISFLPFVRSEGLILLGVFGFYFLVKKQWKPILLLATGHLVYSLAGFFVYHDVLWVFNKIPYARIDGVYGSGDLSHYAVQLYYVAGLPIYILLLVGIGSISALVIQRKVSHETAIIVWLGFLSFFVAHTLFWYLGLFNSMGLKRVFVGVAPLIALIGLYGFNFIITLFNKYPIVKSVTFILILSSLIVFPLTSNPAAVHLKDLTLSKEQLVAKQTADFIIIQTGEPRLVYLATYLSDLLNLDHFDKTKRIDLTRYNLSQLQKGDFIIWDDWYAVVDGELSKSELEQQPGLKHLREFTDTDGPRKIIYSIYQKE